MRIVSCDDWILLPEGLAEAKASRSAEPASSIPTGTHPFVTRGACGVPGLLRLQLKGQLVHFGGFKHMLPDYFCALAHRLDPRFCPFRWVIPPGVL